MFCCRYDTMSSGLSKEARCGVGRLCFLWYIGCERLDWDKSFVTQVVVSLVIMNTSVLPWAVFYLKLGDSYWGRMWLRDLSFVLMIPVSVLITWAIVDWVMLDLSDWAIEDFAISFVLPNLTLMLSGLSLTIFLPFSLLLCRCSNRARRAAYWSPQWRERRRWRKYITKARIRWVRAGAFRRWANGHQLFPRAQQLLAPDFVVGGDCLGRLIVSHGWLDESHPDPDGTQLRDLVQEMDRLGVSDDELVFLDYCSLPQIDKRHPDFQRLGFTGLAPGHEALRSATENMEFSDALKDMHLLYTMGFGMVLVLPEVPSNAHNARPYLIRPRMVFL